MNIIGNFTKLNYSKKFSTNLHCCFQLYQTLICTSDNFSGSVRPQNHPSVAECLWEEMFLMQTVSSHTPWQNSLSTHSFPFNCFWDYSVRHPTLPAFGVQLQKKLFLAGWLHHSMLLQQTLGLLVLIWAIMHLQCWPIIEEKEKTVFLYFHQQKQQAKFTPVLSWGSKIILSWDW